MYDAAVDAPGPPPDVALRWPDAEPLVGTSAVLARPDPVFAPAVFRLAADPALWIDVPAAGRTGSVAAQRDDLEAFSAHWDRHGFGHWLLWAGPGGGASPDGPDFSAAVGDDLLGLGGLRWLWWRDAWVLNVYVRLAARAQGRGLASRLLGTAIDRLAAAVPAPTDVVVRTRPANAPMVGLAQRLGFLDIGVEERELGTYRVLARRVGRTTAPTTGDDVAAIRLRDRGPAVVPLDLPVARCGGPPAVDAGRWRTRPVDVPDDDRGNVALCRCGHSADRPFCDGTHRGRRDRLPADISTAPPAAAASDRPSGLGPAVAIQDDGPLRLCGGVTVTLPDGTVVVAPDGTGLCRCGRSLARPWCDGSHAACGFTEHGRGGPRPPDVEA